MNLDELKKKLLAALPPAIREKLGVELDDELEDDDDIDVDEPTADHNIEEIIEGDEEDSDEEDDEDEDDEDAEKKAKKSKIIRIVVILAVAFFALDEFMSEPTVDEVPQVAAPKMSPAKRAMLEAKKKQEEEAAQKAEESGDAATLDNTALSDLTDESVSQLEETEEPEVVVEQTPVATPYFEESVSEPEPEPEVVQVEVPPETPAKVLKQEDEVAIVPTPKPMIGEDDNEKKESSLDMLMKAVDKSEKMTESTMKEGASRSDPSYIEPPNYLRSGRGLVYNCQENHWACVDKFSYFTCFENQKWNEENSQSSECVTRDVYASASDCAAIQKFYVNKPEPTDFCGNQKNTNTDSESPSQNFEQEDLSNIIAP